MKQVFEAEKVEELLEFEKVKKMYEINPYFFKIFQAFSTWEKQPEKVILTEEDLKFLNIKKIQQANKIIFIDAVFSSSVKNFFDLKDFKVKTFQLIVTFEDQSKNIYVLLTKKLPGFSVPRGKGEKLS